MYSQRGRYGSSAVCNFFFFQAEDGIRDVAVTGVQTCALPISLILRAYPDTNCKKPVGCTGGSDFVWTHTKEFGNKTRGAWHQSAVGQVRYDSLTTCGDNPQGASTGAGDAPMVLAAENDLIWAEALIRGPANLALAATLINHTRVGRGGLPAATAGGPQLLPELPDEQDGRLIGSENSPF